MGMFFNKSEKGYQSFLCFSREGYSLVGESTNTVLSTSQMVVGCGDVVVKFRNLHGMSWLVTCLFIVGETAGGGLIGES
jgi:hypothetical protein